jgi:hypothetical protein
MSLLTVFQQACTSGIALEKPSAVYGSTTREHIELANIANEMAAMIAASHEWQILNKIAVITGDGTTEDFALPADYDRMLDKSQLWSTSLETPLSPISDRDDWLELDIKTFDFVINAWILYAGEIHIKPALSTGVQVKYFYQSNLWGLNGSTPISEFTADTNTFRIDERLLKLGIIWKWREMKGLPYAEDLATYERLLAKLAMRDKGSRIIRLGKAVLPRDTTVAYPQSIDP